MAAPTTRAELTRKRSAYGLTVWRLPERPSRAGVYYSARPHYALAPRHWTGEEAYAGGLIYTSYEDALIGLGRVSGYLQTAKATGTPQPPAMALASYVAQQGGRMLLRTVADWRAPQEVAPPTP